VVTGSIVFGGMVLVALVVFFIIKRKKRPPKLEGTAVPIHDPEEIKEFKKSMKPPKASKAPKARPLPFGKMTNSQLMQMAQAEAGIAPAPADFVIPPKETPGKAPKIEIPLSIKETLASMEPPAPVREISPPVNVIPVAEVAFKKDIEQAERLEAENRQLKEALEREIKGKKAVPASADEPAADHDWKQMIKQEQDRFEELDKKFSAFKVEYEHQKSLAWTKEEVLQGQILQLKEDNEKLGQLKGKMETAEAELNGLRSYKKETEDSFNRLEKEVIEAKRSNQELLPQLKEAQAQAAKAAQDLQLQKMNDEQLINNLTNKIMAFQKSVDAPAAPMDEASKNILEPLRLKNEELIKVNQKLGGELDKLKEFNAQFREKEKILQFELTKARAQSVGLEKICEDFKIHIERLSKVGS